MEVHLRPGNDSPDDEDDDVDVDRPQLINLQLPVALLSNLSSDSRLDISLPNHGSGKRQTTRASAGTVDKNNDSMTLTITRHSHSERQRASSCEVYSVNAVDHRDRETTTDWYYRKLDQNPAGKSESSPSRNNDLQCIGTTTKKHYCCSSTTSKDVAPTMKLKEIGERTRRLLEEERKKRKEIVRLDEHERSTLALPKKHAPPPASSATTTTRSLLETSLKNALPSPHLTTEKKLISNRKRKRQRIVASNIDGWMPNVDDLLIIPNLNTLPSKQGDVDTQQLQQSSIVRLHGLPVGVKPEHVRKFFHGLNPGLIFVLPTFSHPIQGWDSSASLSDNNSQCIVKRHSSTFRVFVKFTSSPVANAAIERSGEPIGFDTECKGDKGAELFDGRKVTRAKKIVGASISISPVSKHDASFLQKHMAIDTKPGEAIRTTAKRIEEQLGTVVTQLIWQMAIQKLNLSHRIHGKHDTTIDNYTVPTNKAQYQTLVKRYNRLIDMHEKLELDSGIIFTHAFDPTIDDSAHRITQSVSNWLLDRVSYTGRLLNESRHWLKLGPVDQKQVLL